MIDAVRAVSPDLLIRANAAAAKGPRGYENAMISVIKALSKEASSDELLAISYRLQPLANLSRGEDLSGFTMNLQDRDYQTAFPGLGKAAKSRAKSK